MRRSPSPQRRRPQQRRDDDSTFQGTGEGARPAARYPEDAALALPQRVMDTTQSVQKPVVSRPVMKVVNARSGTGTDTCQTITEESPDVRHDRRREPGAETCD